MTLNKRIFHSGKHIYTKLKHLAKEVIYIYFQNALSPFISHKRSQVVTCTITNFQSGRAVMTSPPSLLHTSLAICHETRSNLSNLKLAYLPQFVLGSKVFGHGCGHAMECFQSLAYCLLVVILSSARLCPFKQSALQGFIRNIKKQHEFPLCNLENII